MRHTAAADRNTDVLVVGGGIAGFAFATAVKLSVGDGLRVELWEPMLGEVSPRQRVSAISASSRRMLSVLGIWDRLAAAAQPMREIEITDSRLEDAIRPAHLRFNEEIVPGEPFAHVVFNADLEASLREAARSSGVTVLKEKAVDIAPRANSTLIKAMDGRLTRAALVAAADGSRSALREAAGIGCVSRDYGAKAIVCTVEHERDHEGRARQHFLPEGPFAILPLAGRQSSIVWTLPAKSADRIASLAAEGFRSELEVRFGNELGCWRVIDAPLSFDVRLNLARKLVGGRLALIGDAARSIHPLAGQGLNLGLRDAAALAELVVAQARLGLDPGEQEELQGYERRRRFDSAAMGFTTDALSWLFTAEGPVRPARDLALGLINHTVALKNAFILEAAGLAFSPPKLLRGEAL
jgi:2-octaprenyl-6-methoxyphenol hydroxylase